MRTNLTDLLGIKYPIIQGGMQWLAYAEFAAAVSEAGGVGTINAAMHLSKESLINEIRKVKRLTNKPFIVNISLFSSLTKKELEESYFEAVLEEGVTIVETSGRNPERYIPMLKQAGVKIIHKVPAVRYAKKVESLGVDAVTIVGFECGGHPGMDDIASMVLIPKAAESLTIPIIAGGGIVDGRGLVAALALGAQGIVMGTRFIATKECSIHQNFKDAIVNSNETDTMIIQRSIRNAARVYKNEPAIKALKMETEGTDIKQLMTIVAGQKSKLGYESGDINTGIFPVGQNIGLIHNIKTIKEVIDEIVFDAERVMDILNNNILR